LRPLEAGGTSALDYCDADVLRILRRRSLAALRAEVEPVPAVDLAKFLPAWQGIGGRARGAEGVMRIVEQLAGAWLPASALETLIFPSRVPGYTPAMLDELTAAGEVIWSGHGSLPGEDGWIALHPADLAPLTLAEPDSEFTGGDLHQRLLEALSGGGAYFFRPLSDAVASTDDAALAEAIWDLVWAGRISNDTLAALRTRMGGARSATRKPAAPRARYAGRYGSLGARGATARGVPGRPAMPSRSGPPIVAGRWSLLPEVDADVTARAHAIAEVLLERHGVVTRGAVVAERVSGGFAATYKVLSAFEDAGRVRRGYFVEGLGASQFASPGAVDRLRATGSGPGEVHREPARTVVLAAADPANPYGAALAWPDRPLDADGNSHGHRPSRTAGALVVLVDGELTLYVERGGRSLLSWTEEPGQLRSAADALALAVREGALGRLTVERADGAGVLLGDHPIVDALEAAGFRATPRGLRLRA
jgi:ATP-dependent Lhr-like helicase